MPASGRKDPGWKYAHLLNEKDTSTLICIFCDKVTKRGIYKQKQHLVRGFRNSKKCTRCLEHDRKEIEDNMLAKKTQKNQMSFGSHNVNEDLGSKMKMMRTRRLLAKWEERMFLVVVVM